MKCKFIFNDANSPKYCEVCCVHRIESMLSQNLFLCSSRGAGCVIDINVEVAEAWFPVIPVEILFNNSTFIMCVLGSESAHDCGVSCER